MKPAQISIAVLACTVFLAGCSSKTQSTGSVASGTMAPAVGSLTPEQIQARKLAMVPAQVRTQGPPPK